MNICLKLICRYCVSREILLALLRTEFILTRHLLVNITIKQDHTAPANNQSVKTLKPKSNYMLIDRFISLIDS